MSIIDEINVEALSSLSANKIKWLTRMVNQGQMTEKAVVTIKDYVKGFMEGTDETIDEEWDDDTVDEEDNNDEIIDENDSEDETVDENDNVR